MNDQYPFEGLLRPPLEWLSAITVIVTGSLILIYPSYFNLSKALNDLILLLLSLFMMLRFLQGYRVIHYQMNLKCMPTYVISPQQLPVSQSTLFIGRGFLWTPLHTQRLRDLDLAQHLKYRYRSPYRVLRSNNGIGGEPSIHGICDKESDIHMNLVDRAGHTVVIGTTGMGKTRFAEMLITQDIHRGDVVIVLDPKGDVDLLKRFYCEAKASGREKDVLILHLGFPECSARYNPIGSFTKITQVATRVTNALPSTGEAAAFKEFAWKYVNLVTRALVAIDIQPTYKQLNYYVTRLEQLLLVVCKHLLQEDSHFKSWVNTFVEEAPKHTKTGKEKEPPTHDQAIMAYLKEYFENQGSSALLTSTHELLRDLYQACRLDRTYYDKITASVGPLLEKLTSDRIADLLSITKDLNDVRPVFDWHQVIREKKIVYIGLDAMTDSVVSSAVGNAMLSDLVSVAGYLYKFGLSEHESEQKNNFQLPRICLHADEFNEIIGDEFIPILNKARGAGFIVTAYTQTWSDVQARLNSESKTGQVMGNFNNVVMFRTKEAKTVELFLSQLPKIPILRTVPASVSSDTPHGEQGIFYQSSNEDRLAHTEVRLIEQTDILNLPKGQAFALLEGGKLYKLRMPLFPTSNIDLPPNVALLIQNIQQRKDPL